MFFCKRSALRIISNVIFGHKLFLLLIINYYLCNIIRYSIDLKTMTLFFGIFGLLFASCSSPEADSAVLAIKHDGLHQEALSYCKAQKFNTDYYFLVDFSIHSGRNRFFIYNFKDSTVVREALVTHGTCDGLEPNPNASENLKFSNTVDSHCSSQGKYKIGKRDYSSWGINVKYWLNGLESTNNKAVERVVVLHSWGAVSDSEVYPYHAPLSWGCPAVSDNFMWHLDSLLQKSSKPVLLWIVE